jgi:outer membrane protein TolC
MESRHPIPEAPNVKSTGLVVAVVLLWAAVAAADPPTPEEARGPDRSVLHGRLVNPGRPITLADAVARALSRNPTTATAEQEIRRSEAVRREVEATWLPTLTGNGVYTRLDSARISGGVVAIPRDGLNLNLLLTVPIVSGRQWANTSEAKDNIEVQRAGSKDAKRQIALAAGRAYLAVYAQKLVIEVDERAEETAKRHYDYAHKRYAGGVGTSLDEVRAAQEVASDAALVQQAYATLANAQESLGVIAGDDVPLDTSEEPALSEVPDLATGLADASHRTDVVLAERRHHAADRVKAHDYTDYLPFLTGVAEPFSQTPATPTIPSSGYQLELILTLPLYDGGLRYGQARERDALAVEARIGEEAQLRQARSDVRAAFEALKRADDALRSSRDAAKLAGQALDLANLAYTAGATSDLEVIDAERAARDAATQAELAADASRQARLNLLSATNHFP